MMWAAGHVKNCKNPALHSLTAHVGTRDAVRQSFLDPAVFSSKSGLIPDCTAFFIAFSDRTATLNSQHGKRGCFGIAVPKPTLILLSVRNPRCSCGVKPPLKKKRDLSTRS